jgi:hypothetical protein
MSIPRADLGHIPTLAIAGALILACSSSSSSPGATGPDGGDGGGGSSGQPPPPPPAPSPSDAGGDAPSNCPTQYEPLADAITRWGADANVGGVPVVTWISQDCTSGLAIRTSAFTPPKRSDDGNPCATPHKFVQVDSVKLTDCSTLAMNACLNPISTGGYDFFVDAHVVPPKVLPNGETDAELQYLCTATPTPSCMKTDSSVGDITMTADGTLGLGGVAYKRPAAAAPFIELMKCP